MIMIMTANDAPAAARITTPRPPRRTRRTTPGPAATPASPRPTPWRPSPTPAARTARTPCSGAAHTGAEIDRYIYRYIYISTIYISTQVPGTLSQARLGHRRARQRRLRAGAGRVGVQRGKIFRDFVKYYLGLAGELRGPSLRREQQHSGPAPAPAPPPVPRRARGRGRGGGRSHAVWPRRLQTRYRPRPHISGPFNFPLDCS